MRPPRRSTNVIRPFFEPWLAVDEHWVACCTVDFENFEECYSVGFKLGLHRLFFATLGCSGALSGSGREEEVGQSCVVLFMSRDLYARRSLRAEKSILQKSPNPAI